MKRLLILIAVLFLPLGVSGCSSCGSWSFGKPRVTDVRESLRVLPELSHLPVLLDVPVVRDVPVLRDMSVLRDVSDLSLAKGLGIGGGRKAEEGKATPLPPSSFRLRPFLQQPCFCSLSRSVSAVNGLTK